MWLLSGRFPVGSPAAGKPGSLEFPTGLIINATITDAYVYARTSPPPKVQNLNIPISLRYKQYVVNDRDEDQ